ncbi:MAG: phosphoribosylanthranilate isomerase [Elainellaceae cyanobacterium]
MQVKICGVTQVGQARAIAQMGATALGFICVPASPRYVDADHISAIAAALEANAKTRQVERIGVFVDAPVDQIQQTVVQAQLTGVQLHGSEPPEMAQALKRAMPDIRIIKAFRLRSPTSLLAVEHYRANVDALLLDAFHPKAHGGTGQTLDWTTLRSFQPKLPWFLAGGLTPANITQALEQIHPDGIDLSSGVEQAPGQKDLQKVTQLFHSLATICAI